MQYTFIIREFGQKEVTWNKEVTHSNYDEMMAECKKEYPNGLINVKLLDKSS